MAETREFPVAARLFLQAVRTGGPPPPQAFVQEMLPVIERKIVASVRSWRTLRAREVEVVDVVQEVVARLINSPPSEQPDHAPAATVLAWVGRVTTTYLIDLYRKKREHRLPEHDGVEDDGPVDARPAADRLLEVRVRLTWARELVATEYPRGLPVMELLLEEPDLSSIEIAERIGASLSNVEQIRCRIRRLLARQIDPEPTRE